MILLPSVNKPNSGLTLLELSFTAFAIVVSFGWPAIGDGVFARIERTFARLARKKMLSALSVGLSVVVLRLAFLPIYSIPLPFVPDDFSFLLAADTFLHGRLANPTPAMWVHFESIHITMQPTYQSMYFPGEGLLLAAGKMIFGHPWFGLLVMAGLMCAALCWMLQAWLPANWALLGGCIAVIRLGLFSDWINTFHTGGIAGSAERGVDPGTLPRLIKTARFRYGLLLSIGVAIVAITRPYEGLLLCLPVAFALGKWLVKGENRPKASVLLKRAAVPAAVLAATAAWLGYYDLKAFGKATTLPYTVDRETYAIAPYYIWQNPRPVPTYRHAELRTFYRKAEMDFYNKIHSVDGFLPYSLAKASFVLLFYGGFALFPPLIMVRRVLFDRRIRFLVICVLVLAMGLVIEIFLLPHYVAPFTAAFYAIGLQAMRHLRLWKPEGRSMGLALVRLTVTSIVLLGGLRLFAQQLHIAPPEWPPNNWNSTWWGPEHYGVERQQIEERLEQLPGPQLVIVRYAPDHYPIEEWVYNKADIDSSKVIWAREMDGAGNLELTHYYWNRTVWLVEPDAIPARITPYPTPESAGVAH